MAGTLDTTVRIGKARWTRLAVLGFGSAAAAPLILLAAGAAFGLDLADATFFVIPIVVFSIVAYLVWRFGTWAKIVGIVLGLLGGLTLFWMIFGLFVPNNFFDFIPSVLYVPGVLLGVASSVAAIKAGRRGHLTARAEGREARGIRIAVASVAVLAVISGVLTATGRSTADATGAAAQVAMKNFEFSSEQITVPAGSTIYVENDDPFFHTFTVDELGIDEGFTVGSSKTIQIPSEPGTYIFYCQPHSDPESPDPADDDMAGTLIVT